MPSAIRLADIVLRYRAEAGTFVRDNNRAARSLRQVRTQARNLARSFAGIAAAYIGVQQSLRGLGASATFETSLARIQGLVGATDNDLRAYRERLEELAPATGRSLNELAEGLFFVRSAGLEGAAAFETLEATGRAAAAGLGETTDIANAVTAAINTYGEANLNAGDATGILVATIKEGQLEASTLAPVLGQLLPLANSLGVGFRDIGAALAVMSRGGLNAARSSTALRGILQAILAPTMEAQTAISDYGLSFEELRMILGEQGLLPALRRIDDAVGGNQQSLTRLFPNVEGLIGALQILGGEAEEVNSIFNSLASSGLANLNTAFEAVSDTTEFRFRSAWQTIAVELVEIGAQVLPPLADALEVIAANMRAVVVAFAGFFAFRVARRIALIVGPMLAAGGATTGLAAAVTGLTAAMQLIPFIAIATGIGLIISRMLDVQEASYEVIEAFEDVSDRARATLERINTANADQLIGLRAAAQIELERLRGQLGAATDNVSGLDDFGSTSTSAATITRRIEEVEAHIADLTEGIVALGVQSSEAFGNMEHDAEAARQAAAAAREVVELPDIEVEAPSIRERDPQSNRLARQIQLFEGVTTAADEYTESIARQARLLAQEEAQVGLEGPDLARSQAQFEVVNALIDDYRANLAEVLRLEESITDIRERISEARLSGNTSELDALQSLLETRLDDLEVAREVRDLSGEALRDAETLANRAGDIAAAREALRTVGEEVENIGETIAGDVGQAFGDFTRDVLFAFEDIGSAAEALGRRIVAALVDALIVSQVVNAVTGFLSPGLGSLFGGGGQLVPGFAQHGGYHSGLTVVGEVGPELVDFRSPARVYSTDQLADALNGQPGGTTINFSPVIQTSDGPAVEAALQRAFPDFEAAVRAGINVDARRTSNVRRAFRGR